MAILSDVPGKDVERLSVIHACGGAPARRLSCSREPTRMKPKLYLETFGCQMNVLDSELVLGQLRAQGYESTDDREGADVIIYNTCSVREHAEQKVWSRLGELRDRKQTDPNVVIGVI